ncbi:MAG: hypothetical protein ACE5HI_03200 [bacterium]
MLINEVDIFTIVMGKTIEYCSKSIANGNHKKEEIRLDVALKEMATLVDYVGGNVKSEQMELSEDYVTQLEQLDLFVMESKENKMRKINEISISE